MYRHRIPLLLLLLFLLMGYTGLSQQSRNDTTISAPPESSGTASGYKDSAETATDYEDSVKTAARDTFVLRTLPDTVVGRWKEDPDLAYANDPAYWRKKPEDKYREPTLLLWLARLLSGKGFHVALYIILGALLAYAVVRIMTDNNVRLFYSSSRKKKKKGETGQAAATDEMEEDLVQRLQFFIQLPDYRQATRYCYLIALSLLNEKGSIRWHPDTTNQGYLLQLKGSDLEAPFRFLTGIYDKVWYGEFPLSETQFQRLHHYFEDFYKTVPA